MSQPPCRPRTPAPLGAHCQQLSLLQHVSDTALHSGASSFVTLRNRKRSSRHRCWQWTPAYKYVVVESRAGAGACRSRSSRRGENVVRHSSLLAVAMAAGTKRLVPLATAAAIVHLCRAPAWSATCPLACGGHPRTSPAPGIHRCACILYCSPPCLHVQAQASVCSHRPQ